MSSLQGREQFDVAQPRLGIGCFDNVTIGISSKLQDGVTVTFSVDVFLLSENFSGAVAPAVSRLSKRFSEHRAATPEPRWWGGGVWLRDPGEQPRLSAVTTSYSGMLSSAVAWLRSVACATPGFSQLSWRAGTFPPPFFLHPWNVVSFCSIKRCALLFLHPPSICPPLPPLSGLFLVNIGHL